MNKFYNLSIRAKVVSILFVVFILLFIFFYFISSHIFLKQFIVLESDKMEKDIRRVQQITESKITDLGVKLGDWAIWDDAYYFIKDNNNEFISVNLQPTAFETLKINSMIFINNYGEIVHSDLIDLNTKKSLSTAYLTAYVNNHIKSFKFTDSTSFASGYIPLTQGTLYFVAKPVLKSDGSGPIIGSLMFARFIDNNIINDIRALSQLSVNVYSYNSDTSPLDVLNAKLYLSSSTPIFSKTMSESSINGYILLFDFDKEPVLIVKIDKDRDIYVQGGKTLSHFNYEISILIVIIGILMLFFIEKVIVSKIIKLNNDILNISINKDFSKKVDVNNGDEIGNLGNSINELLASLLKAKNDEKLSQDKEREALKKKEEEIEKTDKLNKLMIGRELEMIKLKQEASRASK